MFAPKTLESPQECTAIPVDCLDIPIQLSGRERLESAWGLRDLGELGGITRRFSYGCLRLFEN